jgi:hypothetical protein
MYHHAGETRIATVTQNPVSSASAADTIAIQLTIDSETCK